MADGSNERSEVDWNDLLAPHLEAARSAWPGVDVPDTAFLEYLLARLPEGDALRELEAVNTRELYLACACVHRDDRAIQYLEAEHFDMIEAAVARIRACPAFVDEVKQTVREQALVGSPDKPAALEGYSGRGALGGWLRVVAVRTALRLVREQAGPTAEPDLARHIPEPADDPELEHLKSAYRQEFRTAIGRAIRSLGHQQRNLLRYHYVDGLSIDDLALLYHVHRATVARRIARARQAIFAATRRELTAKLDVGSTEYESILRLIRSRLHITLSEVLVRQGSSVSEDAESNEGQRS